MWTFLTKEPSFSIWNVHPLSLSTDNEQGEMKEKVHTGPASSESALVITNDG